jgi:hypothetical protein
MPRQKIHVEGCQNAFECPCYRCGEAIKKDCFQCDKSTCPHYRERTCKVINHDDYILREYKSLKGGPPQ